MIKIYPFYLLCFVTCSLLLFASCKKADKALDKNPLATLDLCRVSTMSYAYSADTIGISVSYNKLGDPVRITQSKTGTSHPDGIFLYNNQRRLTDYVGVYDSTSFEFWHRYVYDNQGRVVRDTTYFWGFITNGEPDMFYDLAVISYEYDADGRVSHTAQAWFNNPSNQLHLYYNYDGQGNLIVPGVTYDNKVGIHRTHKVWMFIDRNYSVNNGYATAWNTNSLPTHMNLSSQGGQFAGFYYGTLSNINYQCSGGAAF